jgi:hypothetical protein
MDDSIRQGLISDDILIKKATIEAVGMAKNTDAVVLLIPLLKDENWEIREAVARNLGNIGDRQAIEPLITAIDDDYLEVCESVIGALGRFHDDRVIIALKEYLSHEDIARFIRKALESLRSWTILHSLLKSNNAIKTNLSAKFKIIIGGLIIIYFVQYSGLNESSVRNGIRYTKELTAVGVLEMLLGFILVIVGLFQTLILFANLSQIFVNKTYHDHGLTKEKAHDLFYINLGVEIGLDCFIFIVIKSL